MSQQHAGDVQCYACGGLKLPDAMGNPHNCQTFASQLLNNSNATTSEVIYLREKVRMLQQELEDLKITLGHNI